MQRRGFLKAGSLATVSAMALAGCLHSDDGETESNDAVLQWLPVPDALDEELEDYNVRATAPSVVGSYQENLSTEVWSTYSDKWLGWDAADPGPSDVDRLILGSGDAGRGTDEVKNIEITIAEHSLDNETIRSNLESDGFEAADGYEEFDVYTRDEGTDVRGLGDGALLSAKRDAGARPVLEAVIDSSLGNVDRYHEANDDVKSVIDTVDTEHYFQFDDYPEITETYGSRGVFAGSVARGFSNILGDPEVDMRYVEVLTEGADIKQSDIDTFVESAEIFRTSGDVEDRIEGRRLIFEWSTRIDKLNITQLG